MSSSVNLALSGLASGFNWQNLVSALGQAERGPETALKTQQTLLKTQGNAYGTISNDLQTLGKDLTSLADPTFFDSVTALSSDSSIATVTADKGTAIGQYAINIARMATASQQVGTAHAGAPISATSDVSAVVLSSAGFSNQVTAGTFSVNGSQITVATSDTLQQVFDNIHSATHGAVTASYDPVADKINLNASSPITLGSGADTSNVLQVVKLENNSTGSITSSARLGALNVSGNMTGARTAVPISDGGAGAGQFSINGVAISFNASTESISDVANKINQSAAGVTATYDASNDRLMLTDKATGNLGLSLADITGNFLQATGLAAGTANPGQNLLYSINGGDTLSSQSNTITSQSSGINGLSVTAVSGGNVNLTVSSDTSSIQNTLTNFVNDYNTVQSFITTETAVTTGPNGTQTPGPLTGDSTAQTLATSLRQVADAFNSSFTPGVRGLGDIGINSNGNDNTFAINATTLANALNSNLPAIKQLFSDSTNGLATKLAGFVNSNAGNASQGIVGTLPLVGDNITSQVTSINTQISKMEAQIAADTQRWTNEFVAMENAEAQAAQQLQFLTANFSGSGASTTYASNLSSASQSLGSSNNSSTSSSSTSSTSSTGSTTGA